MKFDKGLIPILFAVTLTGFGMSFVTPLIPLVLKDAGINLFAIGQIASTFFFCFTVATLFVGKIVDRIGCKKMILFGLFLYGGPALFFPLIKTPALFYFLRGVQGLGNAGLFVSTEAAINLLSSPENRSKNMAYYTLVFGLGFSLGPIIGATLFSYSRVLPFYFCTTLFMLSLATMLFFFSDYKVHEKKSDYNMLDLIKTLKIPIFASCSYAFIEVSIGAFLSLYLDSIEIRGAALGTIFMVFAIGGIVSPVPAGRIADRIGKNRSLCILAGLLALLTVIFNFSPHFYMMLFLVFGVGFVAGGIYPIALSLIADLVPRDRMGAANSTFSFAFGFGSIIGPIVTGYFTNLAGIKYLFYPMCAVGLIFFFAMLWGSGRNQKNVTKSGEAAYNSGTDSIG
ncbi:MAG: MFS transporter [Candidatus Schekmanbacteria bacterium]|nr:MFS transporter [Candidatus Schekmanbacteria bacterium]